MSQVIARVAVVAFAVVGLFTAGLIGTLGVRGQLDRESLAAMFATEEGEKQGAAADVAQLHEQLEGEARSLIPSTVTASIAGTLLPRLALPSPFSSDEAAKLFDELE